MEEQNTTRPTTRPRSSNMRNFLANIPGMLCGLAIIWLLTYFIRAKTQASLYIAIPAAILVFFSSAFIAYMSAILTLVAAFSR